MNKLGSLKLGPNKRELPIYLIFNSGNKNLSPYAGSFDIPLLTSRIEQIDENTFALRSPSGWIMPFLRDGKDRNLLNGSAGMKALIEEEKGRITAYASCGDKLVFFKGHLIEWQSKDATLNYIYNGGTLSEIRENGITLLKLLTAGGSDAITGILLNGDQKISLDWGKQPIVQEIQGRRIISGMQNTLSKVTLPDGSSESYNFDTDSKLCPRLSINGKEMASWEPGTCFAKQVNGWIYEIKPGTDAFDYAAISRKNGSGQTESWYMDGKGGRETATDSKGITEISTWFTSGELIGLLRKRQKTFQGKVIEDYAASYDEKGKILREVTLLGTKKYDYDEQGQISSIKLNEVELLKRKLNKDGSLCTSYNDGLMSTRYVRNCSKWPEIESEIKELAPGISLENVATIEARESATTSSFAGYSYEGKSVFNFDRKTKKLELFNN